MIIEDSIVCVCVCVCQSTTRRRVFFSFCTTFTKTMQTGTKPFWKKKKRQRMSDKALQPWETFFFLVSISFLSLQNYLQEREKSQNKSFTPMSGKCWMSESWSVWGRRRFVSHSHAIGRSLRERKAKRLELVIMLVTITYGVQGGGWADLVVLHHRPSFDQIKYISQVSSV